MRKAVGFHACWQSPLIAAVFSFGPGCTYPTDADLFPPQQTPFVLTATAPADGATNQPLNPVILLTFSDFPDPSSVPAASLTSPDGTQTVKTTAFVDLARRQVLLHVPQDGKLMPDRDYVIALTQGLRSLASAPLDAAGSIRFHTGSDTLPDPLPAAVPPSAIFGDQGLLHKTCTIPGRCHAPAPPLDAIRGLDLTLPPDQIVKYLTGTVALGTPEGLHLIEPGHPETSYLFRKLLAYDGFTRTEGDPMPMSPFTRLMDPDLQQVSDWIREGAPAK